MSYQTGLATNYADLLNRLDTYLTGTGKCLSPQFTGAGNGLIVNLQGGAGSIAENITITFTAPTTFDVAGSTSGAIGSGTLGTAFASAQVNFQINLGSVAFIAGDVFTFSTTPPWTSMRRVAGSEMIWQAPGNQNTDQILVGAIVFSNVGADYYNWRLGGFTAFDPAVPFANQAGYVGGAGQAYPSPVLNLWQSGIPYWFVANGRRVIVVARISTVYMMAYLGFMNSYMSPGTFPYPLIVGGSEAWYTEPAYNDSRWRWSYTGGELHNFPWGYYQTFSYPYQSPLRLRLSTGYWNAFAKYYGYNPGPGFGRIWPYAYGMNGWAKNLDGGYSMLPIVMHDVSPPNIWGELDGVEAITGFENGAENTVSIGSSLYLVVQNAFRASNVDYCAVKLI
jgi:hypothetical protein